MKTTLEISDPLLREAKKKAALEGVTLRSLVEQGLRQVLSGKKPRAAFQLRKASFKGRGQKADFADVSWDRIRQAIYEERGE